MIKSIKDAFIILKDNLIVVQPLILFLLLVGFVAQPIRLSVQQSVPSLIAVVITFAFTAAFLAGWFYNMKLAVAMKGKVYETPEEKGLAQLDLLKQFFTGVGDYFLSTMGMIVVYMILVSIFAFFAYKIGVHYIGSLDKVADFIKILSVDTKDTMAIAAGKFPQGEQLKIFYWSAYVSLLSVIFTFVTMFFAPVLFYKTKNPLLAFFYNVVFIFKNFLGSLGVLMFLAVVNFVVSFIYVLSVSNIILSVIALLITFFYMSYHVMLIFVYYEEKTKDNCDCGSECIGENGTCC
ncbi:MAG: hypothetical protein PHV37_02250 [Candidatus Gastranaerophilales bacterium]|nr:hypothetical protein [Candidatus Gastranaerophilales bacterium]